MRRLAAGALTLLVVTACGTGDRTPRSEATTTSTTTTTEAAPAPVVASDGTVEVSLTVAPRVEAGERLWADLRIRNVGRRSVHWQAGGCGQPGSVMLLVPGARSPGVVHPRWDGAPAHLEEQLIGPLDVPFQAEGFIGLRQTVCTSDSRMQELAPGAELTRRVAADVRLAPGTTTDLRAQAGFLAYDEPEHYGGSDAPGPRAAVEVEAPVEVLDLPDGHLAALEALAADPALAAFVEATRVASVRNGWYTRLAWWRGAWELTVDPEYSDDPRGQSRLRLRYDPAAGRVVDARRVWWDQAAEDEPGGIRFPGAPADDVEDR